MILAENRILKACLQPGWRLSDGERATLAEIGKRLDRYRGPNENFVLGTTHQAATLMPTAATSWSNAVTTERYNLSS